MKFPVFLFTLEPINFFTFNSAQIPSNKNSGDAEIITSFLFLSYMNM